MNTRDPSAKEKEDGDVRRKVQEEKDRNRTWFVGEMRREDGFEGEGGGRGGLLGKKSELRVRDFNFI